MSLAQRLASGERIADPVAVVVAHPDDESLWLGTALLRLESATLIHLTDGASEDLADAARLGFATREAYAEARAAEIEAALAALGAAPRRLAYGYVDQSLVEHLPELIKRLRTDLAGMAGVLTHPYEGGHPDHDTASLAVRRAFKGEIVEFACYHQRDGERVFGRFWAGEEEHRRALSDDERGSVASAIAAHRTQAEVIGDWRPVEERWRSAPAYDYAAPPPPGAALYDGFGWALTSAAWREQAAQAC
jgi:N-acetylglucosamine malate deacetylase 2